MNNEEEQHVFAGLTTASADIYIIMHIHLKSGLYNQVAVVRSLLLRVL